MVKLRWEWTKIVTISKLSRATCCAQVRVDFTANKTPPPLEQLGLFCIRYSQLEESHHCKYVHIAMQDLVIAMKLKLCVHIKD